MSALLALWPPCESGNENKTLASLLLPNHRVSAVGRRTSSPVALAPAQHVAYGAYTPLLHCAWSSPVSFPPPPHNTATPHRYLPVGVAAEKEANKMLASRSSLRRLRPVTGTVRMAMERREGREGLGRGGERGV